MLLLLLLLTGLDKHELASVFIEVTRSITMGHATGDWLIDWLVDQALLHLQLDVERPVFWGWPSCHPGTRPHNMGNRQMSSPSLFSVFASLSIFSSSLTMGRCLLATRTGQMLPGVLLKDVEYTWPSCLLSTQSTERFDVVLGNVEAHLRTRSFGPKVQAVRPHIALKGCGRSGSISRAIYDQRNRVMTWPNLHFSFCKKQEM